MRGIGEHDEYSCILDSSGTGGPAHLELGQKNLGKKSRRRTPVITEYPSIKWFTALSEDKLKKPVGR